ncbi:hypothetical protein C1E_0212695, partial [Pseudomonas amygdali pv. tabaci str. ATCC 11528]
LYDDQWVEQRFGREVLNMTLADLSSSEAATFPGSVKTPSRASSLPQDVCESVACACASPYGSELARESGGSVTAPSGAGSLAQEQCSTFWLAAERLKQAAFHVVDGEVVARLLAADPLAF